MKKILFIAVLMVLKLLPVSGQSEWALRAEKDGIKIYTSLVPDSKIKALKVISDFNAAPSQMVALLMDINTSPQWVYHLKSSWIIKQVSPGELYYYAEVNLPWPAANRDFVAHLTVTQNPDTKVVTIDGPAVPGFVPIKKGVVRIDNSVGKWIITPLEGGRTQVEYTIHLDPGGSVPSWLVNMFATEAPMHIFKGMRVQLQKPAYRNSVLAALGN
jgi:hypothetical protein